MAHIVPVMAIVVVLVCWNLFLYNRSNSRAWSPLWIAFTTTTIAILFFVAGAIGYTLDKHDRFIAHTAWTGGVVWWEIGVASATAVIAAYCWRKGLESLR